MGSEQVRQDAEREENKALGCVIAGVAVFACVIIFALGFTIGLLLPW